MLWGRLVIFFLKYFIFGVLSESSTTNNCYRGICIPSNYNLEEKPFQNQINNISIGIDDINILKVNDKDGTLTLHAKFEARWTEPRLEVSSNASSEILPKSIWS